MQTISVHADLQDEVFRLRKEVVSLKRELDLKNGEFLLLSESVSKEIELAEKNGKMLQSLVEVAAGKIGQDFFDQIVPKLSEWLNAECVVIGRIVENQRIKTMPLYLDGKISYDFSYDLKGSPFDITNRNGYCVYNENVIKLFPEDKILVDLQAQGYIGTALYNKMGEINGVICAISRNKLTLPPYAREIMKVIGARVSAEIERVKVEEILKRSEKELRESNATKDKFFSIIAHDLKNPFNLILGFTELLMNKSDCYSPEKRRKLLVLINHTTRRTFNLLENLLTWSLSQQGLMQYNPEEINLQEIVSENIAFLKAITVEKQQSLYSEIPEDIVVIGDRNMLSTVLRNLLSNAIKYTLDKGKIRIYCTGNEMKISEQLRVCIEDNGIGMDPGRLSSLFVIYENSSADCTDIEKGTGLGLILCKEFIERQGGTISVESKLGQGSTFTFTVHRKVS